MYTSSFRLLTVSSYLDLACANSPQPSVHHAGCGCCGCIAGGLDPTATAYDIA